MENILIEALNNILLENRESKNINLARKFLKSKGFSDVKAQGILDNIRTDIPNSRLGQCKFLSGIARLYLDGELSDGNSIKSLNKVLKYISSDAHINEYDYNLNNMSLDDIVNRFESVAMQDSEMSRINSDRKTFNRNEDYNIVRIPNFETASEYSDYTSWCITRDDEMYSTYTNGGAGLFYFCLKNGFENVPKEQGENSPLDEYGLSMIAVSVDEDGEPNTITCRWNHDMGGNDSVMTKDELENLLGVNFYSTFKPYTEEELMSKGIINRKLAVKMLADGADAEDIFDEIEECDNGFLLVGLNNKYSYIDTEGKLIYDGKLWFDAASSEFANGAASVIINRKWTLLKSDGKLIKDGNLFFNYIYSREGYFKVELNNKYSYINGDGDFFCGKKLWFDSASDFVDGFAKVKLNNILYFIDAKGNFYDYETKQPIPSPIDNNVNENKKYIKNIIKETINNYLKCNLM